MLRSTIACLIPASLLAVLCALGQQLDDPVGSIFQPAQAPSPDPPVPLQPNPALARPARREFPPRQPPFELRHRDRVLFLGDSLLADEASHGYLETRLTAQYPRQELTFRNLSWSDAHPFSPSSIGASAGANSEAWLSRLTNLTALVQPNVVFVSFGTAASHAGADGLPAFKQSYERLLDALQVTGANGPVRCVLLSPAYCEPLPDAQPDPAQRNEQLLRYAQAVYDLATNRSCEFVNCHGYLKGETQNASATPRPPRLTEDGIRLSAYGYARLTLAVEQALRWPPNNWRFGLMSDNNLRDGGFGAQILQRQRSEEFATVVLLEQRLPTPNVPGYVELQPDRKPQCYIQLPGLNPGQYELRVDDQKVLNGTDSEWARFEIIARGPSWDQAEALRQAIVQKNAAVTERWRAVAGQASAASGIAGPDLSADPQIVEWEAKIQELKRPVKRKYEIIRAGSRPTTSAPAANPAPAATTPAPASAAPQPPPGATNRPARVAPTPPAPPPPSARRAAGS